LLELILELVIILPGLSVGSVPFLCGEQFSQNTALFTAYTINLLVYCLKGNVLTVIHTLSFMVLMYLSISGICSSRLVMLSICPCAQNVFLYVEISGHPICGVS